MHYDGIAPWSAFSKHNSQAAMLELAPGDWLPLFKFSAIQTNEPSTRSASARGTTERLDMTELCPSGALDHLIQDLAHLCQVAWDAYERSQDLLTIVRPFLPRATWTEAIEVAQGDRRALPAETHEASVLRLDIANFTELTDSHPLDQVLSDLNAYLDTMTQIVYRYHGDVNKYLGDGFISVFVNADDAVQAGCAIQEATADFNRHQLAQGKLVFPTRIGITSGQIATVSLGSRDRQDRTVIGAPVNLAERLQEKATLGQVWLSQATFDRLRDQSGYRCLGPIKVKGRKEPVVVYEKH